MLPHLPLSLSHGDQSGPLRDNDGILAKAYCQLSLTPVANIPQYAFIIRDYLTRAGAHTPVIVWDFLSGRAARAHRVSDLG